MKEKDKTLSEAWNDLKEAIFKELKIKQICDWLNSKLDKRLN